MNNLQYKKKYLKYKSKYIKLKGGMDSEDEKCKEREDITVTITLLSNKEFHISIYKNSTTLELYNRIETRLQRNVNLYKDGIPVCYDGTLEENNISDGLELLCIIKEINFLINPENLKNLKQFYEDDVKIIFFEEIHKGDHVDKPITQIKIEIFEDGRGWDDAFSSTKPKELNPMLVLLDILQKYFIFKDDYPVNSEGLFHTTSIINDEIILKAIEENLNDYISPRSCYNLVSEEDMEYMTTPEFINDFYDMFCQPYREDISQDDIMTYITNIKDNPQDYLQDNIMYESDDDY
jgi:hypothetical protein